jgi:hypothetical protein
MIYPGFKKRIKGCVMRILLLPLIVLLHLNLSGCGGGALPKTADNFRQGMAGTVMAEKETFEVSRSFESVAATFKAKASRCLDMTITKPAAGSSQAIVSNWNPTVIVGRDKAEFHLQRIFEGVKKVRGEPEKGHYVMVVDLSPASIRRTRIDMYRPTQGFNEIVKAVKSWATGKDIVCPDMTKI